MTPQDIQNFFAQPAINMSAFCKEAGINKRLVQYIIAGERSLTEETASALLPWMQKYGFQSKPIENIIANASYLAKDFQIKSEANVCKQPTQFSINSYKQGLQEAYAYSYTKLRRLIDTI